MLEQNLLGKDSTGPAAVQELVQAALEAGGRYNVTVLLLEAAGAHRGHEVGSA